MRELKKNSNRKWFIQMPPQAILDLKNIRIYGELNIVNLG